MTPKAPTTSNTANKIARTPNALTSTENQPERSRQIPTNATQRDWLLFFLNWRLCSVLLPDVNEVIIYIIALVSLVHPAAAKIR